MTFSDDEIARYQRHLVLKGVGGPGQNKLKAARVLVVGAGGLGSPVIQYLAAAGVGHLSIADGDRVSLSNLQRQVVHGTEDVGQFKVDSAAEFIARLNPHVEVSAHKDMIKDESDAHLLESRDVVIDATDGFAARKLLSGMCAAAQVPLVTGAVNMFDGQVSVMAPHLVDDRGRPGPYFGDLYPEEPAEDDLPRCQDVGILGAVTGVIGSLMAMEAIKLIVGFGAPLIGRLLLYDGRNGEFRTLRYTRQDQPATPKR